MPRSQTPSVDSHRLLAGVWSPVCHQALLDRAVHQRNHWWQWLQKSSCPSSGPQHVYQIRHWWRWRWQQRTIKSGTGGGGSTRAAHSTSMRAAHSTSMKSGTGGGGGGITSIKSGTGGGGGGSNRAARRAARKSFMRSRCLAKVPNLIS